MSSLALKSFSFVVPHAYDYFPILSLIINPHVGGAAAKTNNTNYEKLNNRCSKHRMTSHNNPPDHLFNRFPYQHRIAVPEIVRNRPA
jgi:hypothetical protein